MINHNDSIFFISVTSVSSIVSLATTEEFQAISSPNYPESCPNEVNRIFIIQSPQDSFVRLFFWDLSLEENLTVLSTCDVNRIVIYEGKFIKERK